MILQFVKFRSDLDFERARELMNTRAPAYREISGLLQKYYGRELDTGDLCGVYIFESQEALDVFRKSDLAQTVGEVYQASDLQVETFEIVLTLHGAGRLASRHQAD